MISTDTLEPTVNQQITGEKKAPYSQLINVTPELAKRWLADCNVKNRKLKPGHAEQIARDIRNGKWIVTHQGIAFSRHGLVVDGQHRLWAVVIAGISVQMYVWFNVDPDSLLVIDRHLIRNKADAINLTTTGGRVTEAELATLGAMLSGLGKTVSLTAAEAQEAFQRHHDAIRFAHTQIPAGCRARNVACRTTRAVIARAFYSADHERLEQFCKILRTGIATNADDQPAALIYQYLTQTPKATVLQVKDRYAKIERALSAFMLFETMPRLYGATRELFQLPEENKR